MRERHVFDYAVIRVVPRVERGEFLNVGIILFCSTQAHLAARIQLDAERLRAIDPAVDVEAVETYLASIPKICEGSGEAGTIGALPQRARFHWLVAPRSTMIQTSAVHSGVHHDLDAAMQTLFEKLVLPPQLTARR